MFVNGNLSHLTLLLQKQHFLFMISDRPKNNISVSVITKRIWNIVSFTLKFEVEWKHIVLGFYNSKSDYIDFLNYLISFIACKIYKYRMFCRLESLDENTYNISTHLKFH